jgi:hypothetical protein
MTAHSYTGIREAISGGRLATGKPVAKADTSKATSTPKPALSKAKPFAGMTTAQILAGLSHVQSASLVAALAATAKPAKPARDPEAEYQRGVANGRAAERIRVRKVYDESKVQGGAAEALKLLATSDLDSTAIIGKLFGHDSSLADAMRKRFEGGKA